MKAYTRIAAGDEVKLDAAPLKAILKVFDPRGRAVIEKTATFSANGSWSDDILLPTTPTGWYRASLRFPSSKTDQEDNDNDYGSGTLNLRVDDYRPNTFEVKIDNTKLSLSKDRIKLPLAASYFMGKPLSEAKVHWNAYRQENVEMPEQYSSYHFGDAPKWSNYGKDYNADAEETERPQVAEWAAEGEGQVSEDGTFSIEMATPPELESPTPQRVRVEAEVTDINEQTISSSAEFALPGPKFMLGLKTTGAWATMGKETSVESIAVTPEGKPFPQDVPVKIKIERQAYHILKVQAAGGGETTKNQVVLEEELSATATLHAATPDHPASWTQTFTPKAGGAYFFTAEAEVEGKKVFSRMPVWVLGGEYPWPCGTG